MNSQTFLFFCSKSYCRKLSWIHSSCISIQALESYPWLLLFPVHRSPEPACHYLCHPPEPPIFGPKHQPCASWRCCSIVFAPWRFHFLILGVDHMWPVQEWCWLCAIVQWRQGWDTSCASRMSLWQQSWSQVAFQHWHCSSGRLQCGGNIRYQGCDLQLPHLPAGVTLPVFCKADLGGSRSTTPQWPCLSPLGQHRPPFDPANNCFVLGATVARRWPCVHFTRRIHQYLCVCPFQD